MTPTRPDPDPTLPRRLVSRRVFLSAGGTAVLAACAACSAGDLGFTDRRHHHSRVERTRDVRCRAHERGGVLDHRAHHVDRPLHLTVVFVERRHDKSTVDQQCELVHGTNHR